MDEFIALAERISGVQLDDLFDVSLFDPQGPAVVDGAAARAESGAAGPWSREADRALGAKR